MSLRSDLSEVDGESNELGHNMTFLHEIAAMTDQREKEQKVAEVALTMTNGTNIFSSGTKYNCIMKTCE